MRLRAIRQGAGESLPRDYTLARLKWDICWEGES